MSATSGSVLPSEGERGLASYELTDLAGLVLPAWDAFIDLVERVDLDARTRLPKWTARDVCAHLGSWPDSRSLERMVREARSGHYLGTFDQEAHNEAVVEANATATRAEIVRSLTDARDETEAFLRSPAARELGARPVRSMLGPLPLLTLVAAAAYELAVHALDLAPAGAPDPPPALLAAGLASLVDVTGALAVRCDIEALAGCVSPEASWAFASHGEAWTTLELPAMPTDWPTVSGPAAVLLDASAGRRAVPALMARRELRIHHLGSLLALAPIVENVPNLPGAKALGGAARHLAGVGRLVRRLPGLSR